MSDVPVVAVTGATGYVGSIIVDALKERAKVLGLVRTPKSANQIHWSFDSHPDLVERELRARGVSHLVHAAWDMNASFENELQRSCVAGSRNLLTAARQANLKKVTFISTISAFEGARSAYGRSKLKVEDMFRHENGLVLRLGLVYGERSGGAFGKLRQLVRTARIIPMIGDGKAYNYLLDEGTIGDVARRTVAGEFEDEAGPLTLANPEPITFRDLLRRIAQAEGRNVTLVPVPWRILYLALYSAERLRLQLNVRSDSVLSFVYQNVAPDFAAMTRHSIRPIPFLPNERSTAMIRHGIELKANRIGGEGTA
jgi:nucleoside-diphosphate-sugar epimerase